MPAKGSTMPLEERAKHGPKNLTPEQLTKRAVTGGKASQTPETWAKNLVRHWPAIPEERRHVIRTLLAPVVNGGGNGA